MITSMRVEDRLDGADNFRSWKHRILLILEENELLDHVKQVLPEPEEEDAKAKYKKNEIKAKRILTDSIKDHLIPNVSELKTPKEMFDALSRLYESKNTSRKLTLRHQLRNVMMNKSDTVSTYFMRISQIKDQLAAIGDSVDDAELVTTTLNGFPSSWDAFVQGICARSKLPKFDKLWTDCTQEESRLISKSQKTNDEENQALAAHVKKRKERRNTSPKKTRRSVPDHKKDVSKIRCFTCKKLGHFSYQCPQGKGKRKHHAHATDMEESTSQKRTKESKDEEYVFVSALTGTITQGSDIWLVDSGASKHMTGFRSSLTKLTEKSSSLQVELGDDSRHAVRGVGEASYQLDSGNSISIKDVLFVQGLKKNLLSISALEDKGFRVAFVDGQVLLWPKSSSIDSTTVIGVREGGLYKLKGHPEQALVHNKC
jgi:hypothetical protein